MVRGGVRQILIANMVVGPEKSGRLARLCHDADVIVAVDHYAQAESLAAAARAESVQLGILVEVDIGLNRVGTRPGIDALRLCQGIARLPGLRLAGIMGYEGHLLQIDDPATKRAKIDEAIGVLRHTRDRILEASLPCEIVSAGGTGSYQYTADCEGVTELQAGGGIFGDPFYSANCGVQGLTPALSVLTTVVSRPVLERAIVDAGRKAIAADPHMPLVRDYPEATVEQLSAEHGRLRLCGDAKNLQIGERILLTVGYADFTTMLHGQFFGIRDGRVQQIFEIQSRRCPSPRGSGKD